MSDDELNIGDYVVKTKGYEYPGKVVGKYYTSAGGLRYIVELAFTPLQHIFAPSQVALANEREKAAIKALMTSETRGQV